MNFDIYIKEILERLREISNELKDIRNGDAEQNLKILKLEQMINGNSEKIDKLFDAVEKHQVFIDNYKKTNTEISGFVKYAKYVWIAIAAALPYIISHITWNR